MDRDYGRGRAANGPDALGVGNALIALGVGLLFAVLFAAFGSLLTGSDVATFLFIELGLLGGAAAYLAAAGHALGGAFRTREVPTAVYAPALQLGVALLVANFSATVFFGPSLRDIELVTGPMSAWERALLAVTVAAAAPLVEEALFRGLLQGVLERVLWPWAAIVAAALPFALLHGWPGPALFFFAWSLPLGWIAWRTGSIVPGIVVHVVNNLVGLVGLLATGPVKPEAIETTPVHVFLAAAVLPLVGLWVYRLCLRIGEQAGGPRPRGRSTNDAGIRTG